MWHTSCCCPHNLRLLRFYHKLSQHHRQRRAKVLRTETAVAHHTTVSTTCLEIQPMQVHPNGRPSGKHREFPAPTCIVVETVQKIAVQQPEEINISPLIGDFLQLAPRLLPLINQDNPTSERLMTIFEAEIQEISE